MRSLVRVIKIGLLLLFMCLRFALTMLMVECIFIRQWGLVFGLAIVTGWMYAKDDAVKEWADKI